MLLRYSLLEEEEQTAKRNISRLQRDRDSGVISDYEYEERYETVMQDLRLKFAEVMDGRSWEAYNNFKNGNNQKIQ